MKTLIYMPDGARAGSPEDFFEANKSGAVQVWRKFGAREIFIWRNIVVLARMVH